ncbi:MAG TPA: acyltransferase [Sulfuricurvum sp.]|nr:acyltransferase [Sulfuricurvum sp.]HQT36676.1 acyltransferase [Sulfuricurvum sp.]
MINNYSIAKNVKIYDLAKIISNGNNFSIDEYSQVDDFVFINAGIQTSIGKFVHISSFTSIIGGGELYMEDFSGLSAGCRIITGSDDFSGPYLSNPTVPAKYKNVKSGIINIGKHAIIGSNAIILPNITIGEGATVGAGGIVAKDLEPWSIYIGYNPKKVGERDQNGIIDLERKLRKEFGL